MRGIVFWQALHGMRYIRAYGRCGYASSTALVDSLGKVFSPCMSACVRCCKSLTPWMFEHSSEFFNAFIKNCRQTGV